MSRFGFKELDSTNWLESDLIVHSFVRIDPKTGPKQMTGKDWVDAILKPGLLEEVPEEVQALYEVARGAMLYGYFFYPLYTLGAEQLFRVSEAAITHKCASMNTPKNVMSMASRIRWLYQHGEIPDIQKVKWNATRELRNMASHLERQSIMSPGNAIGFVERTAELINSLWKS